MGRQTRHGIWNASGHLVSSHYDFSFYSFCLTYQAYHPPVLCGDFVFDFFYDLDFREVIGFGLRFYVVGFFCTKFLSADNVAWL